MSDPNQVVETVDTVAKVGGGGLLGSIVMVFIARVFKSSDSVALLMAQNAALDATLKTMIADVASLKSDVRQVRERIDAALSSHRASIDGLKADVNKVRLELGLAEKTHEIAELKAELEAATEVK